MKMLTSVIFLCMVFFQIKIIKMEEMNGMPGDENNKCNSVTMDVIKANKNTKILSPHSIVGQWVSERCESRSGRKFVLRSYTFFSNQTFQLIQFYSNDESCSVTSYTVTMVGSYTFPKLKRRSSPSAGHIEIALLKATIIAFDERIITDVLRKKCPNLTKPSRKPHEEYILFSTNETILSDWNPSSTDEFRSDGTDSLTREKHTQKVKHNGCLAAFNLSLDELNTVRIQSRRTNENGFRYELLLANTYYIEQHLKTLRYKFQSPLILVNGSFVNCHICDSVAPRTNMFIKDLLSAKIPYPLYVNGEWISERCEALSIGSFSMRALRLRQHSQTWEQQTFYYTDYTCSNLTMEHFAFGNFKAGASSKIVPGAFDVNFFIEKSFLTVFDEQKLQSIRTDQLCSVPHNWQLKEKNEIPSQTGCTSVQIIHQSKNFDIARLELDDHGTYLLYLGDEDSTTSISPRRPTAYKYPLLRCSRHVDDKNLFPSDSAVTIIQLPTFPRTLVITSVLHVLLAIPK